MKRTDWDMPSYCAMASVLFICMAVAGHAPSADTPHPIAAAPLTDRLLSFEVYDGDTLTKCTIDLGYGITLRDSIRIDGIDTPEVTGSHRPAGLVVRDAVSRWLGQHEQLYLIGRGREKYGRILGDVQPVGAGQTLGEWLIERGYAKPTSDTGKRPAWTQAELDAITTGAK